MENKRKRGQVAREWMDIINLAFHVYRQPTNDQTPEFLALQERLPNLLSSLYLKRSGKQTDAKFFQFIREAAGPAGLSADCVPDQAKFWFRILRQFPEQADEYNKQLLSQISSVSAVTPGPAPQEAPLPGESVSSVAPSTPAASAIEPSSIAHTARTPSNLSASAVSLPEEAEAADLWEGARQSVLVNKYERNAGARAKCIAHYGAICFICKFDFAKKYGTQFDGFIHVHHKVPLAAKKSTYRVDPVADLIPVCANCHAIIHFGGGTRSVDDVKKLITKREGV